jgi:EmrB/QacA subfamily drug resistance transporter
MSIQTAPSALAAEPKPGRWKTLAVICLGLFMVMVQSNVINLAVPRIQADFGADLHTVEWITNGYLLVFTVFLLTLGRLGDEIGRKRVFAGGLAVFSLGALLNLALPSTSLGIYGIILGSVVQGLGGAAMMPATMSLVAANFEAKERGMALGIWGAVSGLAVAVGPTLGGYLTDVGMGDTINQLFGITQGWRYIYILTTLLGLVVLGLTLKFVPESKDHEASHQYDIGGIVLSAVMLFSLVFGLINGSKFGWWEKKENFELLGLNLTPGGVSATPFFLAAALVFGLAFVLWENSRKTDPLMDLNFFKNRNFTAGSTIAAILNFAMMGSFFLIPVFLQGVLGYSATQAGLVMLPMALAVMFVSPLAGKLSDIFGSKWVIVAGMSIMALGSFLTAQFRPDTASAELILPFIVLGAGIALAMSPITNTALLTVSREEVGGASGTLSTIRQLGSLLGIAILTTVFSTLIPDNISANIKTNVAAIDEQVVSAAIKDRILAGMASGTGGEAGQASSAVMDKYLGFLNKDKAEKIKEAVTGAMKSAATQGLVDSINTTFQVAASVALFGALLGFLLQGRRREAEAPQMVQKAESDR